MKKSFFKIMLSFAVTAFVVSCSGDDNGGGGSTCSDGIQNGDETGVDCGGSCTPCADAVVELSGDVTEDTDLDASKEYSLTAAYIVKAGASLTIPAGTVIKASGGTAAFIGVERGAQIFINGTAEAPVVMTSSSETPAPGDWGGLVI
ncbi:hypothetical protein FOT42_007835, partial [Flagellimonas hadalis]